MGNGIKIQINSLEALERLIGNDTELEIEIRNSIVQDFTKKHLKSIATRESEDSIKRTIRQIIGSEFNYNGSIKKLSPEFYNLVEKNTDELVKKEMYDFQKNYIKDLNKEFDSQKEEVRKNIKNGFEKILRQIKNELKDEILEELKNKFNNLIK